eukprot:3893748-Prymnesium_polylepis.1
MYSPKQNCARPSETCPRGPLDCPSRRLNGLRSCPRSFSRELCGTGSTTPVAAAAAERAGRYSADRCHAVLHPHRGPTHTPFCTCTALPSFASFVHWGSTAAA